MFRKLHISMTIFSTTVTGAILIAMTLICLFISESYTKENSYAAFTSDAWTCISQLESQTTISHRWILETETKYGIRIKILDNGKPLYFGRLNPSEETEASFDMVRQISMDTRALDPYNAKSNSSLTQNEIFRLSNYYACTALIPRSKGVLGVIVLYPLGSLKHQLFTQRLAFAAAALLSCIAMAVFAWFSAGRMILPLKENQQKQTEFIASASHELRSPLTVIHSSASAIEKAAPEEIPHFSGIIQRECSRMGRLIGDMLSLANADNHSWKLLLSPCELDTLLLETYEEYEPLVRNRGLHFDIHLPGAPIPACTCDSARISQVLAILLDNAVSYVPSGGKITLSLDRNASSFLITVSDNGPGIPDTDKSAVFQRFYRADASHNDKQHFGLGLSIAREILLLHHGSIQIQDTPGGGATFFLKLPV